MNIGKRNKNKSIRCSFAMSHFSTIYYDIRVGEEKKNVCFSTAYVFDRARFLGKDNHYVEITCTI